MTITTTSTGRSLYVGGQASKLDTEALIEAAYQQKLTPAYTLDAQVKLNSGKIAAYKTLDGLLDTLQSSMNALRYTSSTSTTNIFGEKSGVYNASNGTDPSNIAGVSITQAAAPGNYDIEVKQVAKAAVVASASQSSKTTPLGLDGSFNLGLAGGTPATINVTAGQSLQDVASSINAVSATTGVKALVVLVAEGQYQLTLTASSAATAIEAVFVSGADVLQTLGVINAVGDFANTVVEPQKAIMVLNNVSVERNTNNFDDLIEGVTFNLKQAAPGTMLSLEITPDTDGAYDAIAKFVDAYNGLREFVMANQTVTNGAVSDDAMLFADSFLRSVSQQLSGMLGGMYNTTGSVSTLRDLGIAFDVSNKLMLDGATLTRALKDNFDGVRSLFETDVTISDAENLRLITHTKNNNALDFTLDITTDGSGAITSASVNGDNSLFTINGTRIVGKKGTAYEGLTFAYAGNGGGSINVKIAPGLANGLYNTLDYFASGIDGSLQSEMKRLEEVNSDLTARGDTIRTRAELFREKQVDKYAKLETAVQAADILQRQIEALLGNFGKDE